MFVILIWAPLTMLVLTSLWAIWYGRKIETDGKARDGGTTFALASELEALDRMTCPLCELGEPH